MPGGLAGAAFGKGNEILLLSMFSGSCGICDPTMQGGGESPCWLSSRLTTSLLVPVLALLHLQGAVRSSVWGLWTEVMLLTSTLPCKTISSESPLPHVGDILPHLRSGSCMLKLPEEEAVGLQHAQTGKPSHQGGGLDRKPADSSEPARFLSPYR